MRGRQDFSCEILLEEAAVGRSPTERMPCDGLWDGCAAGDGSACHGLFFASPLGSAYETLGEACGILLERGDHCDVVIRLLTTD